MNDLFTFLANPKTKFSKIILSIFCCLFLGKISTAISQRPARPDGAEILQSIKKLQVLGSVLYVAAHPDDENQRFISYMANVKNFDVTYLSLTRGDGGQNLIGPELREMLGVLRTEELQMARSIDGGKQQFSRANDFGFSKNPEETLHFWERDEVLSDVVWQFRKQQPDVVVNRFFHDKKYDTHGHHTASAMLSVEAFDKAGQADVFPEQLKYVEKWQPRRIFFNTSWFFYGSREAFDKTDKSNLWPLDIGIYLPLKGKSNNELAAEARSMHRCQGFGGLNTRGETLEYFDFIKGEKPAPPEAGQADRDMFSGINTTWTRVAGGSAIGKLLAKIEKNYRADDPAASVPELVKTMRLIKKLPDSFWKNRKLNDIKTVIKNCMGLYLEAGAAETTVTPGATMSVKLEFINRLGVDATLAGISILPSIFDTLPGLKLMKNKFYSLDKKVVFPKNLEFTAPYWLQKPSSLGMYSVENQELRGVPETPRAAKVRWQMVVLGEPIEFETDIVFKKGEPDRGEVYEPFDVLPPVFVGFSEQSYLFPDRARSVEVHVKAGREKLSGAVNLEVPAGWTVSAAQNFELSRKGEEKILTFSITAPEASATGQIRAVATVDGEKFDKNLSEIRYDHIPVQRVLRPSTAQVSRLDVKFLVKNIGYIMGAGDEVPASLRQAGVSVSILENKDLELENLKKYEAIVVGIRAYNTRDELKFYQKNLFDYVENGGTLVVQYQTSGEMVVKDLAPFPMKIGRARVTDETAEIRFSLPDHVLLNSPNKLTSKDFEGWVQERGLYFASEWDAKFAAPISLNDPGEPAANGSILVAQFGKGQYVFTGISFFREMPFGVPGAVRLFANLVSVGR